jgi:hypothetical protein
VELTPVVERRLGALPDAKVRFFAPAPAAKIPDSLYAALDLVL